MINYLSKFNCLSIKLIRSRIRSGQELGQVICQNCHKSTTVVSDVTRYALYIGLCLKLRAIFLDLVLVWSCPWPWPMTHKLDLDLAEPVSSVGLSVTWLFLEICEIRCQYQNSVDDLLKLQIFCSERFWQSWPGLNVKRAGVCLTGRVEVLLSPSLLNEDYSHPPWVTVCWVIIMSTQSRINHGSGGSPEPGPLNSGGLIISQK